MPIKIDLDATTGRKLLTLYHLLILDGRRHFLLDLADRLNCSKQTVIRLIREIEGVAGANLTTGMDKHRRWYQIRPIIPQRLEFSLEEIRYLRICRDLSEPYLPKSVKERIDKNINLLSLVLASPAARDNAASASQNQFLFFSKGYIDYSPYRDIIEILLNARKNKQICMVQYKALGKNDVKLHRFIPGSLVSMNNGLYALGADFEDDFVTVHCLTNLAIHRIVGISLSNNKSTFMMPPADPGTFGLPWHEPRQFHIHFKAGKAAAYVRERIWADRQILTEHEDGSLDIQIITRSQPELTAWVRSFGDEAEMLAEDKGDVSIK